MIPDRVSIHDRPAEADGKRFGDWEMDPVIGKEQKSLGLHCLNEAKVFSRLSCLPKSRLMSRRLSYGCYVHIRNLF